MLRKDDVPFKTVVDRATSKLYQSPEIQKIYDQIKSGQISNIPNTVP